MGGKTFQFLMLGLLQDCFINTETASVIPDGFFV